MSDNKKYYYLKLKDTFFDSEEIKILESMENGIMYCNLYLKMCVLSLKTEGRLMFRDTIPYDPKMLATITRLPIDTIRAAIEVLRRCGLVEIADSGAIFMTDIQRLIGHGSTEGERIANYRQKIALERNNVTPSVHQRLELRDKRLKIKESNQEKTSSDAIASSDAALSIDKSVVSNNTKTEEMALAIDASSQKDKECSAFSAAAPLLPTEAPKLDVQARNGRGKGKQPKDGPRALNYRSYGVSGEVIGCYEIYRKLAHKARKPTGGTYNYHISLLEIIGSSIGKYGYPAVKAAIEGMACEIEAGPDYPQPSWLARAIKTAIENTR